MQLLLKSSWLVECASRRQKWIDQAQSLNIYMAGASGKRLDDTYKLAWLRGLKTTYYLRTMGATSTEKSTSHRGGQLNAVDTGSGAANFSYSAMTSASASTASVAAVSASVSEEIAPKFCAIDDPDCEACQ
jgi:ribonucleoside-diphosphate reductase alpha chain